MKEKNSVKIDNLTCYLLIPLIPTIFLQKFFIRTAKKANKLVCSKTKQCMVTKKLRTLCQYCRYKKCLHLGMYKPGQFGFFFFSH